MAGEPPSPCAEGFTLYEGVCYKLFTTNRTWSDAEAECNELPGGHLAVFHSQEDFNVLTALMGVGKSFSIVECRRAALETSPPLFTTIFVQFCAVLGKHFPNIRLTHPFRR